LRQAEVAPVQIIFKSINQAKYFVGRCNSFRGLDRQRNAEQHEVGHPLHPIRDHGESVFDALRISRVDAVVTIMPYMNMEYDIRDLETGEVILIGNKHVLPRTIPGHDLMANNGNATAFVDSDNEKWSAAQQGGKLFDD
jgi:hypothetical protein